MRFKIERVRYSDGGKSPWWRLVAYKHGFRYGESPTVLVAILRDEDVH